MLLDPISISKVSPHRWLYQLMISQDANFRLKNRLRTGSHEDPWLGPGLAYCVDDGPYGDYVMSLASQEDVSAIGYDSCYED